MGNEESGFGNFPEIGNTKWDSFKHNNQPVFVSPNGGHYCGLVKEINENQNYVTLQPAVFTNVLGTEFFVKDKPIKVPFDTTILSINQETLEEYCEECTKAKLQERIAKRRKHYNYSSPSFLVCARENFKYPGYLYLLAQNREKSSDKIRKRRRKRNMEFLL